MDTPWSDRYQIVVVLLEFHCLSAVGLVFAEKLNFKTVIAADAAEDPYLQTAISMC